MTTFSKLLKSSAVLAALTAFAAMPTTASAQDISVSTGVDLVSDYVFRGVSLADTAIQPYVEASVGSFTFGAWASTPSGDTSIAAGDEIDLYASYNFAVNDIVSLDVGGTYYHFPQGGSLFETEDGAAGTYEASLGASFDTVLAPSVTAYYDFTLEAFTVIGNISHSIAFPENDKASVDLGLTAGLVDGDGFGYEYGTASASLGYALSDNTSTYIGANYTVNSEDALNFSKSLAGNPKDTLFWFGAGISAGF